MAIVAPKCDRCGKRTRNEVEGRTVCDNCAHEMQLIVESANENVRKCPLDGSLMKKEIAHSSFNAAWPGILA